MSTSLRNIAIIAHVDHGKTTLVDALLKQTNTFRHNQAEMTQTTILDSNDLERERGITILAKNTAVQYGDTKINIIDTPGHADFSGEVERVISLADGALLIVDAAEGPLPQTRFVLEQALKQGHKVIVVINKIDRQDAEPVRVLHEIEELFLNLAADDSQLEFPVVYAVAREGKTWKQLPADFTEDVDISALVEVIIETIPEPKVYPNEPFKMLVSNIDFDAYKGQYAIGRVNYGILKSGQRLQQLWGNEKKGEFTVQALFTSQGLGRVPITESMPGDIISITGSTTAEIGQTMAVLEVTEGFPPITITEPTLSIVINSNTSPFGGQDGKFATARQLEDRFNREVKTNIGLKFTTNPNGLGFLVSGRGELHLSILVENMRREGLELEVGKPQVILRNEGGVITEPMEELVVEVPQEFMGVIVEEMGKRLGQMQESSTNDKGISRMVYHITSRNLLGFRSQILTKTRGNGLFNSHLVKFVPQQPTSGQLRNGVLVSSHRGQTSAYALEPVQKHGQTFIGVGIDVYEGMIIGIRNQQGDLDVNPTKLKKSTNVRAASADMGIQLAPPVELSLEQCLDFIEADELVEVAPTMLRLRKKILNVDLRVKANRK